MAGGSKDGVKERVEMSISGLEREIRGQGFWRGGWESLGEKVIWKC